MAGADFDAWKLMVEKRLADLEAKLQSPALAIEDKKPMSLAEFLRSKGPETGLDKAMSIAYFLEKYEKQASFSLPALRRGFVSAKEPLPANSRDLVHRALKLGLMMETGENREGFRALVLTNSGLQYVEDGFKTST